MSFLPSYLCGLTFNLHMEILVWLNHCTKTFGRFGTIKLVSSHYIFSLLKCMYQDRKVSGIEYVVRWVFWFPPPIKLIWHFSSPLRTMVFGSVFPISPSQSSGGINPPPSEALDNFCSFSPGVRHQYQTYENIPENKRWYRIGHGWMLPLPNTRWSKHLTNTQSCIILSSHIILNKRTYLVLIH